MAAEKDTNKNKRLPDSDEEEQLFLHKDGKTYYIRKKKVLFQDFQLQIVGEIVDSSTTYWLMHLKPRPDSNEANRSIVLSQGDLVSPVNYIKGIQKSFCKANLGPGCEKKSLRLYVQWLQDDYGLGETQTVYEAASVIGFVGNGSWVLSPECHYKDGKPVVPNERKHFVINPDLLNCKVFMRENLVNNVRYFMESMQSFSDFTRFFANNYLMFHLATSFTLLRLFHVGDGDLAGADEPRYGMIASKDKSCGKSTASKIIMLGQGCPNDMQHPFVLSGGNLNTSGSSKWNVKKSLVLTNLVINLNDVNSVSDSTAEFLLQSHDGLLSGVKETGLVATKASILMSTNQTVHERLKGRVFEFFFTSDPESFAEQCDLKDKLIPFMEDNKGLLLAFVMHMRTFFATNKNLKKCLENVLWHNLKDTNVQSRLVSGWASILAVYVMLRYVGGESAIQIEEALVYVLGVLKCDKGKGNVGVLKKFESCLRNKLEAGTENMSNWVCKSSFKTPAGHDEQCLALPLHFFSSDPLFAEVDLMTLKQQLAVNYGKKIISAAYFAQNNSNVRKQHRAIKIPMSVISDDVRFRIDNGCVSDYEATEQRPEEINLLLVQSEVDAWKHKIRKYMEDLKKSSDGCFTQTNFIEELSPISRQKYQRLSSQHQCSFKEGFQAAKRLFSTNETVASLTSPITATTSASSSLIEETTVTATSSSLIGETTVTASPSSLIEETTVTATSSSRIGETTVTANLMGASSRKRTDVLIDSLSSKEKVFGKRKRK